MAAPIKYERIYSFSGFQATNPNRPLPAAPLDNELANVETSISKAVDAINDIRGADGRLKNGIVTADAFAPGLATGVDPATNWATGIAYSVNATVFNSGAFYRCLTAHTSGTFAIDLAANRWELFADYTTYFSSLQAAATNSANSAATSATQATNSANSAATSATAAASAAASIALKYDKAGGTLTGDVIVTKSNPIIALDRTVAGQFNILRGRTNGSIRWDIILGDDSAEGGSNAGSQFAISRYSDAAAFLGYGMTIRRSDGYTVIPANTEIGTAGGSHSLLLRRFGTTIGGTLQFEVPSTGSTLNGPVRMRVNANSVEISEAGGTSRGVSIDLTTAAAAAGSALIHAGNLGAQLAAMPVDSIGSYGLFFHPANATTAVGTVVSGSVLLWTNNASSAGVPPGQWVRHGLGNASQNYFTLYKRVA